MQAYINFELSAVDKSHDMVPDIYLSTLTYFQCVKLYKVL